MKRPFCAVLAVLLLLSACGQKTQTGEIEEIPEETSEEFTASQTEDCIGGEVDPLYFHAGGSSKLPHPSVDAGTAISAVLRGETGFYYPGGEMTDLPHLIAEYSALFDPERVKEYLTTLEFSCFDISDMNDRYFVVVSLGAHDQENLGQVLLRWYAGEVYGYVGEHLIGQPKADGSYLKDYGESEWEWEKIAFAGQRFQPETHRFRRSQYGNCYVDEEEMDPALFNALLEMQEKKPNAKWYTLTEENIADAVYIGPVEYDPYQEDALVEETAEDSGVAQVLALYRDFLTGSSSVRDADNGRGILFLPPNLCRVDGGLDGEPAQYVQRFALCDLDGDGTRELILEETRDGVYVGGYEILTCHDGMLSLNTRWPRAYQSPKADGTFGWSSGAFDNGYARIHFENGVQADEDFAFRAGDSYMLHGKHVSEEQYRAFEEEQDAKPDLPWAAFTEENLRRLLPTAEK